MSGLYAYVDESRGWSGGEQRRLHAGMAMVGRPRILLLDEPTVGVDVESRAVVLDLVRSLAVEGTAVCYTTHYLAEVEALDPHVVIIDGGRVVATGSVRELVAAAGGSVVELRSRWSPPWPPPMRRGRASSTAAPSGSPPPTLPPSCPPSSGGPRSRAG